MGDNFKLNESKKILICFEKPKKSISLGFSINSKPKHAVIIMVASFKHIIRFFVRQRSGIYHHHHNQLSFETSETWTILSSHEKKVVTSYFEIRVLYNFLNLKYNITFMLFKINAYRIDIPLNQCLCVKLFYWILLLDYSHLDFAWNPSPHRPPNCFRLQTRFHDRNHL